MKTLLVIFTAALIWDVTFAQRAFRCVDEHGAVTYQQVPCQDAREVEEMRFDHAPNLTPEEEFRRTAFQLGLTPEELRQLLHDRENPAPQEPGIIVVLPPEPHAPTQPARSEPMATRCTKPNGHVYYTLEVCGFSRVGGGSVIGPQGYVGEVVGTRVQDTSQPAPYSEACQWANQEASNTRLSSDRRRTARALARTVCQ